MDKNEFSQIRNLLGKTQAEMAELLGVSLKAIQSFEQGGRKVPVHIERQLLFLLSLQRSPGEGKSPCWVVQRCPAEVRENCPAWEFRSGHLCWFINGTICHGEIQKSWEGKMAMCRQCKVFQSALPFATQ